MAEQADVVFVDGVRTPFGRAGEKGMYWNTRADDLIVKAIIGLLERHPGLPLDRIDEVAIAATTQQGDQGLTLGRTAALLAGLPKSVPGFAIDRMCAGAMTSVTTLGSGIAFGAYDLVLAGGVEHMGRHPMGLDADPNPRFLAERLVSEDALNMGKTAERIHDRFPQLTKERSDRFGMRSQQKVAAAYEAGRIQPDLVPVALRSDSGWGLATGDEGLRPETTMEGLAGLKTPFRPHGRVTAGNASPLTDGATVSLLASASTAKELGLTPKMRLVSFAFAGVEPEIMGIGPVPSTEKALRKAGLSIEDIGLFELNEAFAVQVLSFLDHFGIDDEDPRVNPWGGAIAVGHPLAASGVRLMIQLAAQFAEHPEVRYGLTAMCVGLGQGGTVIWENPYFTGKKGRK
ncbi:thiolase family protein [Plantibacter sp. MCCC 1A11337]|uniref:Acetyl-CoA acyltransferase n=2 Tax=Plantibacter TaxID=190323 RepID=A0ABY1LM46_9MICO|nr:MULTISPECIES: thiolase family protein [Plantibacter]MBD8102934.1 thiolase family protein [Plantibacter sp. CFBP 8775]NUJ86631.1 thiolase family protein [Plantibacter sp. MCCC 1A11337]AQX80256.1 acetyl-CoA acetyltransferase [Plantibacter flavus]OAN35961.1 acetyl-CoA acetyltransferase [Plantibacter sp. H53]OII42319.1 acetyl-CoA acetyltransferase [Plantibacter sp. MMLR14_011]